jgi:D-amino peptidase
MTKLLIIADMEGISGIERYEQCARGHAGYQEGVRLLCAEINVIAEAAFERGAKSVSVIDWHGGGGNIDPEQLDKRVEVVPEDLSPGYDLALLVGFHPMAGDQSGFISHTMTQGFALEIDGAEIGELSLLSWWLGEHGIPVGLITGDRAATAEADRLFPDTPTHTVKTAESWSRAACVPVEQTYEALKSRVARVLEQRERWKIYRPPSPIHFRFRLRNENETVPLIPWLTSDGDGWLSGQVERARDLIDLIDVVAALMALEFQDEEIAQLAEDPNVRETLRQISLDRIDAAINRDRWKP